MQASNQSFPPFPPFPCASRYVAIGSVEEALARVRRAVTNDEGISLIIGPPGTGKSLICSLLNQSFAETHHVCVMGEMPIADPASFQQHLLHLLDVEFIPGSDANLQLAKAINSDKLPDGGLLILIDEAQSLSPETLNAIRTATNIMKEGQPRVSAVLVGSNKLDETLTSPSLEAFTQRIATRCYLHPLNADETRGYISGCIQDCGGEPENVITDEAMGAIHHACSGIPRLINQMMTEAIDCAADAGETLITDSIVDQAWAKLQQLPSPVVEEKRIVANDAAPVEFGSLVDSESFGDLAPRAQTAVDQSSVENSASDDSDDKDTALDQHVPSEIAATLATCESETIEAETSNADVELKELEPDDVTEILGELLSEDSVSEVAIDEKIINEQIIAEESVAETLSQEELAEQEFEQAYDAAIASACEQEIVTPKSDNSTVQWSDDTDYASIDTKNSSMPTQEIFGKFDHEEQLAVEATSSAARTPKMNASTATAGTDSMPKQSSIELDSDLVIESNLHERGIDELYQEQLLHNEILHMNEMAAQARFGGIDEANLSGPPLLAPAGHVAPPELKWNTEEAAANATASTHGRDDSDLLIIEDEVNVAPAPHGINRSLPPQPLSIDFQAMLAKMRTA